MSRIVKGIAADNVTQVWMVVPDITVHKYTKEKDLSYLDVFYNASQALLKPGKKADGSIDNEVRRLTLNELDNRVVKLKFFAEEAKKQLKKIVEKNKKIKREKRVYSYKQEQILISYVEAYLDTLHGIYDALRAIDKLIGRNYHKDIWKHDWFKIDIDLRNLFHHLESPHHRIEDNKSIFMFERISKLNQKYFFKESMKDKNGRYTVELDTEGLATEVIDFLNFWAKKHLSHLSKRTALPMITGFKKSGELRQHNTTLGDLYKSLNLS